MNFGKNTTEHNIEQYTLSNKQGSFLEVLTLGAVVKRFCIALEEGHRDIVLGFDSVDAYMRNEHYLGCVIGRYANRIHNGFFAVDGTQYQVDINQAGNCLHGGTDGFNKRTWTVEKASSNHIHLSLVSKDGDQGFPGCLHTEVTYSLSDDNELAIRYRATSDKTTVFNPTQHSYFNLDGHSAASIINHKLQVFADNILEVDENGIPTGQLKAVSNTAFDFTHQRSVYSALSSAEPLIEQAKGLDHNWCINNPTIEEASAFLVSSSGDLSMQVNTTMPGLQIYTGNFLSCEEGKENQQYNPHQAICLESQFYPDSPNQETFPSALLKAGDIFESETRYKIKVHQSGD